MLKKYAIPVFVLLCSIAFTVLMVLSVTTYVNAPALVDNQNVSTIEYQYILKEYDGKIAVFYPHKEEPSRVLNIYTQNLPEDDIKRLKNGIDVTNLEQLEQYIADFDS